ncbi:MAG: alpha/beta hydrolase [Gaiellaceae bacterium MAG52_C11]|nr:alpha/beta hydrolase [Candidatus Gaiellasilicea maunaloa]
MSDIVAVVQEAGLNDVILVGHSYSGIPVGQAAAKLGDRVNRVVYLDANIPHNGQSFIGGWSERGQQTVMQQIMKSGGWWPPPEKADVDGHDLTDDAITKLVAGSTPHPGRTLTEPANLIVSLGDIPSTYVKCLMDGHEPTEDVSLLLRSDVWELKEINTGHWPMFSQPEDLAALLIDAATGGAGEGTRRSGYR